MTKLFLILSLFYEVVFLGDLMGKDDDWNNRDEFIISKNDLARIIWGKFPKMKTKTLSDDGLKSRCYEDARQLFGFWSSTKANDNNTGKKYLNLCHVGLGGRCIAPDEDKTDYQSKSRIWKSISGNSTGLYDWNSRFFIIPIVTTLLHFLKTPMKKA
jgi:hypothetical protein